MKPITTYTFLGLLCATTGVAFDEWDQERELRRSKCDNGCFFGSFPGGSCTDDAACMCTQQKYRERYFCCMAEKCEIEVLEDSIERQSLGCETRNLPFTFDTEAVCGIKLSTKIPPYTTYTVTATAPTVTVAAVTVTAGAKEETTSAAAAASGTDIASSGAASSGASSSGAAGATTTGAFAPSATPGGATVERAGLLGVVAAAAFAIVL
ncbi:hypothetical protein CMUS01_06991 [Colletotrichum musicola]|uniref:Extracellular membrane protein CFEM domain-containing protein n=1 Tax=Colletotrichum musicola TaxID=2175873 RepID=A0A8H6KJJ8_9PEZI|nr:hypothetical protein CMUS01_06991 [Colletotrichum musicola]